MTPAAQAVSMSDFVTLFIQETYLMDIIPEQKCE